MLTDIANIQTVSDRLKGYILKADVSTGFRRVALRMLTGFENLPWIPLAMEEVLKGMPALQLEPVVSFAGSDDEGLEAIDVMIRSYESLIQPGYTAEEAAEKLAIKIDQFNKYTQSGRITPNRVVGTVRFFSQAELDRFTVSRRKPGRQRQTTPANDEKSAHTDF